MSSSRYKSVHTFCLFILSPVQVREHDTVPDTDNRTLAGFFLFVFFHVSVFHRVVSQHRSVFHPENQTDIMAQSPRQLLYESCDQFLVVNGEFVAPWQAECGFMNAFSRSHSEILPPAIVCRRECKIFASSFFVFV